MTDTRTLAEVIKDPVQFTKLCWPDITLYNLQRDILYSVRDNDETYVVAANEMGKDFVTALAVLWFFVSRRPAKVVTTSVKADQLEDVLWAEIRRFIDTSTIPLPIQYNHLLIRQLRKDKTFEPRSALTGQVTRQGESLLGRHLERGRNNAPSTMAAFDEASGIDDQAYNSSDTWAHRKIIIGNPYQCTNFFFRGVNAGDLKREKDHWGNDRPGLYRKIIRIKAEDSPNVRLALAQLTAGKEPTNEILIPGVIDYETYRKRRALWDPIRQSVGLDAEFYKGSEILMFPPEWLNRAEKIARQLKECGQPRLATAIGVDVAEGGDDSCWAAVDRFGIIEIEKHKTPDTSVIDGLTEAFMKKHKVRAEMVFMDAGGGGKQVADRLRARGLNIGTVGFGESVRPPKFKGRRFRTRKAKVDEDEFKQVYANRRSEMYGRLRNRLDPSSSENGGNGFGLPQEYAELRRQLSPVPLIYDEGRMVLPAKRHRFKKSTLASVPTFVDLIGCSPDEADAVVLAVYGMETRSYTGRKFAGAL